MDTVTKTVSPIRRLAHAFFKSQVCVRTEGGLRLELAERGGAPRPPSRAELAAQREREEFKLILAQLAALLNDTPGTRDTERYLAFIEQTLHRVGLNALYTVPPDVLGRALEQFEALVTNWEPAGLASLRSRMAVAVQVRDAGADDTEASAYRAGGAAPQVQLGRS